MFPRYGVQGFRVAHRHNVIKIDFDLLEPVLASFHQAITNVSIDCPSAATLFHGGRLF
jgi:hypothetical protein